MNELIKKLERQCWDHQTNHLDTEKFAELIIRECIESSTDLIKFYIDTHTEQEQVIALAAIANYSAEIMKRFDLPDNFWS